MSIAPLLAQQIRLNAVDLMQIGSAPNAGGGVAAQIGSFALENSVTPRAWLKTTAPNTGWQQLQQSFEWYSVRDYNAVGNGIVDDTASVQAAINACAAAGGGVVFFPHGTYACSQLSLTGKNNVQLLGSGASSVIKWVFNAGGGAGSLLTISANASRNRVSLLQFDGSGLTNPAAGRTNHLVSLVGAGGGVVETQFFTCRFTGMPAGSGDAIHGVGTAGNLVSRVWVSDCVIDGASHACVGLEQGWEYVWINGCYLTGAETEIMVVATASLTGHALQVYGNEILHTSGSVRHALRIEGDSAAIFTKVAVGENVIDSGMATLANTQYAIWNGNVETSGAYASADPVLRVFGNMQDFIISSTFLDRASGASVGPMITVEKATSSPIRFRIGNNVLSNETTAGGFIKIVDCTDYSIGSNLCRSTNAGGSTMYGIDVQAVTVAVDNVLIGPGNHMTAGAGSMAGGVHLLANGANVTNASIVGNQGDETDYGLVEEIGGGGGTFNGQVLYAGNNFDSTVGDYNQIGFSAALRIGFNAGALGANYFTGNGSPEAVVTANIGSIYSRRDGGANTALYYKETGSGNTGWIAMAADPILFGVGDTTTVATAVFMAPGFVTTAPATEIQVAMTRAGVLRNLRVQVATAGTDNQLVTIRVRKNGVDTALLCTIANDANGGASDTADTVAVAAGDLISLSITKAGVVTAGQKFMIASLELA